MSKRWRGWCSHKQMKSKVEAARAAPATTEDGINCMTQHGVNVFGRGLRRQLVLDPFWAQGVISRNDFSKNYENKVVNFHEYFRAI